jgi:exonuclease VII small subunit
LKAPGSENARLEAAVRRLERAVSRLEAAFSERRARPQEAVSAALAGEIGAHLEAALAKIEGALSGER